MDDLKIIKYLDGEMSGEELRSFEDEIRMSPPLAEEIERYRKIQELARKLLSEGEAGEEPDTQGELSEEVSREISDAVRDYKKDPGSFGDIPPEYRESLDQAGQDFMEQRARASSMGMIRRIWYSAAAVVVLAVIVSMLVFKPFSQMTPAEIYTQYFSTFHKTDEIAELARNDNDFLFAVQVYEAGDYDRAAVLFEMLSDSSDLRSWSLFYAGCSYMSLNRISRAADLFRLVVAEGDPGVVPAARWQLALCYIRQGDPAAAREHLELLETHPEYRRDAARILRLLGD